MNLKACTFERLAFISLEFGRGAQVGKASPLEVCLLRASVDVGRIHFLFGTLQALGPTIDILEEDRTPGSGAVLRHSNAFVRDVLTAPSNVNRNLVLNLPYSYL